MKTIKQRKRLRKKQRRDRARSKRWFNMRRIHGPLLRVQYTWRVIYDEASTWFGIASGS